MTNIDKFYERLREPSVLYRTLKELSKPIQMNWEDVRVQKYLNYPSAAHR